MTVSPAWGAAFVGVALISAVVAGTFMVPGPAQEVAAAALDDDAHATAQRERYRRRLDAVVAALREAGLDAHRPGGAFYVWLAAPDGDGAALTRRFAAQGVLVTPGSTYGPLGDGHVRLALVVPLICYAIIAGFGLWTARQANA